MGCAIIFCNILLSRFLYLPRSRTDILGVDTKPCVDIPPKPHRPLWGGYKTSCRYSPEVVGAGLVPARFRVLCPPDSKSRRRRRSPRIGTSITTNGVFVLYCLRLALLCPSGEDRLRLGKENKNFVIYFAFHSACTTLPFGRR